MLDNIALDKAQETMIDQINPFEAQSRELLVKAEQQEVNSEQDLASAVAVKKQITAHRKLVTDTRLGITRQFDEVKKAIMNREAEILLPLDKAQSTLGEKMLTYTEEQERIKKAEAERIQSIVMSFSVNTYTLATPEAVDEKGASLKKAYADLSQEDQKMATIKVAFTQAVNALADRKAYLEEQIAQEEERKRLEAQAAEQSEERNKLEAEKAAVAEKERKIAAEKERLEREKQRKADEEAAEKERERIAREEKNSVKTGARTVTSFEIESPWLVPRKYCEPSDKLIRAAVKEGVEIPGVKVTVERKI